MDVVRRAVVVGVHRRDRDLELLEAEGLGLNLPLSPEP